MRRLKTVRRPPIYPKTPGHLPCSSLTHPLPLSSRRPSVSFGGFGFNYTDRLRSEILKLRVKEEPDARFIYKSGDAALLALVLERSLGGKTITQYMQEKLWTPLGMEYDGIWSLDREGNGLEKTWCCLAAAARDFAKFGRLYLRNGDWDGEQVVSWSWVEQSTKLDSLVKSLCRPN